MVAVAVAEEDAGAAAAAGIEEKTRIPFELRPLTGSLQEKPQNVMIKNEIDLDNFDAWLATAADCRHLVFQAIDLRPHDAQLSALPQAQSAEEGNVYLGCQLGPLLAAKAAAHHGVIFPALAGRPYAPFRHALYDWKTLFDGYDPDQPDSYRQTTDWKTYLTYIVPQPPGQPVQYVPVGPDEVLARRLHDHFITDEMEEFLELFRPPDGRGVVAVMGGHDKGRDHPVFKEVARLARELTRAGFLIATGGGPGLMEAANLGAWFAGLDDELMEPAIDEMAAVAPSYKDSAWLSSAWRVRQRLESRVDPTANRSLGIPTWFYGHEPPNIFATHIAKYFENSLREEGLLAIASHGVIFAEGNAGTVQEIFQDACQNYYVNYRHRSPMILFGSHYWEQMPDGKGNYLPKSKDAWNLLRVLAREKGFESLILSTDSTREVVQFITAFTPPEAPLP